MKIHIFPVLSVLMVCLLWGFESNSAVRLTDYNKSGIPVRNYWQNGSNGVSFIINSSGSKTLASADAFGAIRRAFAAWEAVPTATIDFIDQGVTSNATVAPNGTNLVIFDPDGSHLDYPPGSGVIAATLIYTNDVTGYITDADIVLNERDFIFTVNGETSQNQVDLEGVVVHEIGHFLGLDHSPLTGNASVTPTMNPYVYGQLSVEARSLQPDDVAGVSWIYPDAGYAATVGEIAGRVLRPDGRPVFGAHVIARSPGNGQFVISGLSSDSTGRQGSGEYRLRGLPPGNYVISIAPVTGTITDDNFGGMYREFDVDFQSEYWDNAADLQSAGVVTVAAGAAVENINIVTGLYAPGFPEIVPGPPLANTFDEAGPYPVTMTVIDNAALTETSVLYRLNNGPEVKVSMTFEGGTFRSAIPGQMRGTAIAYAFEAMNSGGNRSRYPTGTGYITFSVLPPPAAPLAYILMRSANILQVLDTETRETVAQIPVGQDPLAVSLSPDQRRLYVANRLDNSISIINTATHRTVATLPAGIGPVSALISPDNHRVYVANSESSTITVIDADQTAVSRTITLSSVISPGEEGRMLGFALSPDGTRLYTADLLANRLFEIDAATGSVLRNAPTAPSPRWIACAPNGSRLYVTSFDGDGISVINRSTFQTITTISTLTVNSTFAMIVAPDGQTGYATSYSDGKLIVLDLEANQVAATLTTGGTNPRNLHLSPDGKTLYVSNQDSDNLSLFDTASLTLLSLVGVLDGPRDIQIGSPADVATGLAEAGDASTLPQQFTLLQNFPNPFNPTTAIRFTTPHVAHVRLSIYDLQGRLIDTLVDGMVEAGNHAIPWNGRNANGRSVASGIYFATLQTAEGNVQSRKMLLLR